MRDHRAMSRAPLAAYPALRLRRLRQADWVRRLVRESVLTPADLIWSMVVHEGEGRIPVASMPGVERLSVEEAAKAAVGEGRRRRGEGGAGAGDPGDRGLSAH
jgi:hypothetical protein